MKQWHASLVCLLGGLAIGGPARLESQVRRGTPSATRTAPASRLGSLLVWQNIGTPSETYRLAIPPALDTAIRRVAPTWRPRRIDELTYKSHRQEDRPQATNTAIVADLDGDGVPEAVLMGVLRGDDRTSVEPDSPGKVIHQTLVLLGIREMPGGFEVKELLRQHDMLWTDPYNVAAPPTTETLLSPQLLTPQGKRGGKTPWISWQDSDCKSQGFVWTVRANLWVKAKSPCSYGD